VVEHNLAKVGVESSNLFSRSKYGLKKRKKPHFTVRLFFMCEICAKSANSENIESKN